MKYTATKRGTFPTGVHWTEGESRDLELPEGVEAPDWLQKAKTTKAKKKSSEG
tara:strand:- start:153 stop:311 length:159 start_codon:yes stop_codon:yes gene_type:complete